MTLIVTHKGFLAVDSIRYGVNRQATTGAKTSRRVLNNNVNKLVIPEGEVYFSHQRILAIARCGRLKTTMTLVDDVLNEQDLADTHPVHLSKGAYGRHPSGRLIILTTVSTWELRVSKTGNLTTTELGNRPHAVGTGSKVAVFLMKHLDFKPLDALNAAMLDRSDEGDRVRYVSRKKDRTLTKPRVYVQHPDRTKIQVAQRFLSGIQSKNWGK